jgi:hypothetical protein
MKQLTEWLWRACAELGLRVELGYKLALPDVPDLIAIARIQDRGAPNGMLIFGNYDETRKITPRLIDAGYGFSVLDEPTNREGFDIQTFKDVFADWGWSGEPGRKSSWMY